MITIPIKINREDKVVMVRCLEAVETYPVGIGDLNRLIVYESYTEILSKLRASQHNDRAIRLNLVQTHGFMSFISSIYSNVGNYEFANALHLVEDIRIEIIKIKL